MLMLHPSWICPDDALRSSACRVLNAPVGNGLGSWISGTRSGEAAQGEWIMRRTQGAVSQLESAISKET